MANASVASFEHPEEVGVDEETLFIDMAWVGERDAGKLLLSLSGTHGQEGFAGSAAQIDHLLRNHGRELPSDCALAYIHAANPYGFSHFSRTTENNVDLNRNFVDHRSLPGTTPLQATLQELFAPASIDDEALARVQKGIAELMASEGADAVVNAATSGQYTDAEGLNFGGRSPEWSNRILRRIVTEHFAGITRATVIDWHVGLGEYAKPFFLCFNEPDSALFDRAAEWWGDGRIRHGSGFGGAARPSYLGLLVNGLSETFPPGTDVVRAVVEFGTFDNQAMLAALIADRWHRFRRASAGKQERDAAMKLMRNAFYPDDSAWRDAVIASSSEIYEQALNGLKLWEGD